jgi:hypothetical protein
MKILTDEEILESIGNIRYDYHVGYYRKIAQAQLDSCEKEHWAALKVMSESYEESRKLERERIVEKIDLRMENLKKYLGLEGTYEWWQSLKADILRGIE